MQLIQCFLHTVVVLSALCVNLTRGSVATRRHGIFPYVTAGEPTVMHPEEGLHPEETVPPALPNVRVLEETITKLLEEARRRETTQEEQERLARLMSAQFASGLMGVSVSGPAADAYIAAGLAGVEAASAMTTSERFGKRVSVVVTLVGIIASVPFLWFALAGGAEQLYKAFVAATSGIAVHAYFLSWWLNLGYSDGSALFWSLFFGALVGFAAYSVPRLFWLWVIAFAYMVVISGLRLISFFGPFAFVGGFPGVSAVSSFYVWLLLISVVLAFIHVQFLASRTQIYAICNALVIGFLCSWVAISGIASICETLFHLTSGFIYLKFFSIPATFSISHASNAVLTLVFIAVASSGSWINFIRYKQFGLRPETGGEAASLVTQKEGSYGGPTRLDYGSRGSV